QAVSKHIQVLVRAGLVRQERTGRISRCRLDAGPIFEAAVWLNRYSKYWQEPVDLPAAVLGGLDDRRAAKGRPPAGRRTAAAGAAQPFVIVAMEVYPWITTKWSRKRTGWQPARSCCGRKKTSPGCATSSAKSGAICRGCASISATCSTDRTARRRWSNC